MSIKRNSNTMDRRNSQASSSKQLVANPSPFHVGEPENETKEEVNSYYPIRRSSLISAFALNLLSVRRSSQFNLS